MEMMIEDLKQLRESEDHIEFKEAKRNYPFAGGKHVDPKERRRCVLGYIVALANEKGGRLVLGMADKMPHTVVGSDFAQDKVGELTDEIYERLGIRIEATELYEDGKRVLAFFGGNFYVNGGAEVACAVRFYVAHLQMAFFGNARRVYKVNAVLQNRV